MRVLTALLLLATSSTALADRTSEILDAASTASESASFDIAFVVAEDFVRPEEGVWELERGDRATVAELVRAAHEPRLAVVASDLEALGATNVQIFALTNIITATIPARAVSEAFGLPLVSSISLVALDPPEQSGAFDGENVRTGMRINNFINAGFDGNAGRRGAESLPVRIAFVEADNHSCSVDSQCNPGVVCSNGFCAGQQANSPHDHVGYRDTPSGASRVQALKFCSTSSCSATSFASNLVPRQHADAVVSSAAGSIEQGQDSSFAGSGTIDQRKRSGTSSEAEILFYRVAAIGAIPIAIDTAYDDGADVVSLSLNANIIAGVNVQCRGDGDVAGLNSTIDLVSALGMLVVAAAGNAGHAGGCTLDYPALRPSVLSVGSLETQGTTIPSYEVTPLLTTCEPSAKGGLPILVGGITKTTSGIGVVAPGVRTLTFTQQPLIGAPYDSGIFCGSSVATPIVSGTIADRIDEIVAAGLGNAHQVRFTRARIYLDADRFSGTTTTGTSNDQTTALAGYGRVRAFLPNDSAFGANSDSQVGSTVVSSPGTVTLSVVRSSFSPVPVGATQLKAVMYWDEFGDLDDAAAITFELDSRCYPAVVASKLAEDVTDSLTKRISLNAGVSGKCPFIKAHVNTIPAGRTIYWAWMWHSGASLL